MRSAGIAASLTALFLGCSGGSEAVKNNDRPTGRPIDAGLELMGDEEKTGVTRDVDFMTEDGVIIRGTFHPSPAREKGADKGDGAVLLVHQLGSSRSEWVALQSRLQETHSVLTIDLRGHGESLYRNDGTALDYESFDNEDWSKIVLDVRAGVIYLRDLRPPPRSITLVGSSIGSSAVLLHAAEDEAIDSLVMLSPGLSYRGLATSPAVEALGDRPALLLASKGDRKSAAAARKLAKSRPQVTARVFDGEGHGVSMTGPLVPTILEFVSGTPADGER